MQDGKTEDQILNERLKKLTTEILEIGKNSLQSDVRVPVNEADKNRFTQLKEEVRQVRERLDEIKAKQKSEQTLDEDQTSSYRSTKGGGRR